MDLIFKTDRFEVDNMPPSEGTVLGMDLSLTETGITAIDKGIAYCSAFSPPKGMNGIERLDWFDRQFSEILEHYKPCSVAIEGYGFASNRGFALGELGALARLAVWRRFIPLCLVAPTSLKKFATGSGNSGKGVIIKAVWQRWGFDLTNDNVADSAAAAVIAYHTAFPGKAPLTAFQTDVMKKIVYVEGAKKPVPRVRTRLASA